MAGTIAFIPARGGSKSVKGKNIKPINGQPLIYWTIQELIACDLIDQIFVSTDCDEIEESVRKIKSEKLGVFRRSYKTATDSASTESSMLEFIKSKGYKTEDFVLVQATSPFTLEKHFTEALEVYKSGFDSVLSVVNSKRFFWTGNGKPINYDFLNRPRRQDFEGYYMENGAFYISNVSRILDFKNRLSGQVGIYEMPEYTGLEIDEPDDWLIAEHIMKSKGFQPRYAFSPRIQLLASDVDGVLTDAGMYYSEYGDELKKFNTRDGKGFELLRQAGIKTAIITSEDTEIVARRAKKLKVDYLYQGKEHGGKLEAIREICDVENISLDEVAYIGDDINCMEALNAVGLAACPNDAVEEVKNQIDNILILKSRGGEGAVREMVDFIVLQK